MITIDESASGSNLQAVAERVVSYGVQYYSASADGYVVVEQDNLWAANNGAKKLNGTVVQRITYITNWEPYFDAPFDAGANV